ncbi:LysR family transcriptional regulator [Rhodopseudomonas sp. B29]|uniref:LysR family transcriptional regulator n=1 Tax=Rhodopseudomonas sp. B29 TaxID=95607 RepID=UPI00034BC9D0|nr:LysR family transcriptional regulator [Rhodopseudomonas sp. B29]
MALTSARMRAVNEVFDSGSFAAAARRIGVSQSAVAQLVRELEAEFGVTLFDRHGQNLIPTSLCRQLYAATSRMQAIETEAMSILQQREELSGGELRVGLGNSMPGMALVAAFKRLYPKVRVAIEIGSWSTIVAAVSDQRVDIGVLPEVPDDRRFRRELCLNQRVVVLCHPGHPLKKRKGRVSIADLTAHPLVFRTRDSSTQRVVDRAFQVAGLRPEPAIVVNTREGMLEAVANHLGIGFMWEQGSSRMDRIAKISVPELDAEFPEYVFSLAGKRGRLVELFFLARGALPA